MLEISLLVISAILLNYYLLRMRVDELDELTNSLKMPLNDPSLLEASNNKMKSCMCQKYLCLTTLNLISGIYVLSQNLN